MHPDWIKFLRYDPFPILLNSGDLAVQHLTRNDLLDERLDTPGILWVLPEVEKIINKQKSSGCWVYPQRGKSAHPTENYDLLQTYRTMGILIEMYGMDKSHPAIARGAEYLLNHQTEEGDIRGIFGSQYAPHYTAGMLELLIKAGFGQDSRIKVSFDWYENTRQDDGGWAWPLRTTKVSYQEAIEMPIPVKSDPVQPFSHALTGFVIRAYAAHPEFRKSPLAIKAGKLLKSRFFKPDKYPDRRAAEYWFKFQYPFWWGNLLTVLDSLSRMEFPPEDPQISQGLEWFQDNQLEDGSWPTGYGHGPKSDMDKIWVSLVVCRILKRFSL